MARAANSPLPDGCEHETLLIRRGARSGVTSILAVHSTVLGPALGGCRMWAYPSLQHAVADALRLSQAMTLKAAAAGAGWRSSVQVAWAARSREASATREPSSCWPTSTNTSGRWRAS